MPTDVVAGVAAGAAAAGLGKGAGSGAGLGAAVGAVVDDGAEEPAAAAVGELAPPIWKLDSHEQPWNRSATTMK